MSFNISKKMLDVMKVTATVNIADLTKVQRTKFDRYMSTGFTFGNGVPAVVAHKYMVTKKLPHIHNPYGGQLDLRWTPTDHPLREFVRQAVVMSKIEFDANEDYDVEEMLKVTNDDVDPDAPWWKSRIHIAETTRKVFNLHKTGYEVPSTITFNITLDDDYPHDSM